MRYSDIIEGSSRSNMEVYHWTDTEGMIRILHDGQINLGASTHTLNGKTLHGVSITRDAFLDLSHTYAVSGKKPWRIGLNYERLRQSYRVVPIRDDYLRNRPRGVWGKRKHRGGYVEHLPHDEMEEFVLSDIAPLDRFVTSIAVEHRWIDGTVHPGEVSSDPDYFEEEFDINDEDQRLLFSILKESNPELFEKLMAQFKPRPWRPMMVFWPDDAQLKILDRSPHMVRPIEDAWAWILRDDHSA